ncbi:MAG: hypothetical protein R3300_03380 [Candidatus Promineifilaceae bacterium]|nr:hypothetical protein [Candidatus Promineifilaceae bacterium]
MAQLRILSAADVRRALPMDVAVAGMKEAFAQLSAGATQMPLRSRIDVAEHNGVALFMPAYMGQSAGLAIKIVGVYPDNVSEGLPMIHAAVLVLDAATGQPLALLEGSTLTAIRTGAGSGAATDVLARDDAETVAILGSGVQARTQLEAVCTVRSIRSVRVYSPTDGHAENFAAAMAGRGPIPTDVAAVSDPATAVRGADIVCTATTSHRPVFAGADLASGAHVNAVGSFTPEMQEVDVETIRRALVVIDSHEAVMEEAGDLLVPLAQGQIETSVIHAELGQILNGDMPGRSSSDQITYFKSCGVAVQDVVAAQLALKRATAANLGTLAPY